MTFSFVEGLLVPFADKALPGAVDFAIGFPEKGLIFRLLSNSRQASEQAIEGHDWVTRWADLHFEEEL